MPFNEDPLKKLKGWVGRILFKDLIPTEAELVQQVILGNEVHAHPEFADMDYVNSKYAMCQLDVGNRDTAIAVLASYELAHSGVTMPEPDTWLDFIVRRLLERNY